MNRVRIHGRGTETTTVGEHADLAAHHRTTFAGSLTGVEDESRTGERDKEGGGAPI
jgi:hypothetical protein